MIGYIKGKLISYKDGKVLLENNGIGYEIFCSAEIYKTLIEKQEGEVFIYTSVKEDDISLYGFVNTEEKELFLKLISVSGVGPKSGIGILSCMSVKELTSKITAGDVAGLSSVKGLGKKTAERIVLELKDKISADNVEKVAEGDLEDSNDDVIAALLGLGLSKQEISKALAGAKQSGAITTEQQIAFALKHI